MTSAPDRSGRNKDTARKLGARFVAFVVALLLVCSFPIASAGLDTTSLPIASTVQSSVEPIATPDIAQLTLAAESSSEGDRFRTGSSPAVFAEPPRLPLRIGGHVRIVYDIFDRDALSPASFLPFGRGPPVIS